MATQAGFRLHNPRSCERSAEVRRLNLLTQHCVRSDHVEQRCEASTILLLLPPLPRGSVTIAMSWRAGWCSVQLASNRPVCTGGLSCKSLWCMSATARPVREILPSFHVLSQHCGMLSPLQGPAAEEQFVSPRAQRANGPYTDAASAETNIMRRRRSSRALRPPAQKYAEVLGNHTKYLLSAIPHVSSAHSPELCG